MEVFGQGGRRLSGHPTNHNSSQHRDLTHSTLDTLKPRFAVFPIRSSILRISDSHKFSSCESSQHLFRDARYFCIASCLHCITQTTLCQHIPQAALCHKSVFLLCRKAQFALAGNKTSINTRLQYMLSVFQHSVFLIDAAVMGSSVCLGGLPHVMPCLCCAVILKRFN